MSRWGILEVVVGPLQALSALPGPLKNSAYKLDKFDKFDKLDKLDKLDKQMNVC